MENLLFYLLGGLLMSGKVVLCDEKVAGQDALRIELECSEGHYVASFTILRSELNGIRSAFYDRLPYMSDSEIADFHRLFNALP